MASVFESFRHRFTAPRVIVPAQEPEEDLVEKRRAFVEDMRLFVGTEAYKRFRESIEADIQRNEPEPTEGSDVGACKVFKQSGLRQALNTLDHMVKIAEETLPDE